MRKKQLNITQRELAQLNEPNEPEQDPEPEPSETVSEPEPFDEDTVEIHDTETGRIFELSEAGKQTRVNQIYERMEQADHVLAQRDQYGNKQVYQAVKSYVQQFEGIAHTHGFSDFLKHRDMGVVMQSDVQPIIAEIADDNDASVANPERFPIVIEGAEGFIGVNTLTVQWESSGGELSSGTETSKAELYLPMEASERAFRETFKFQSDIGLEIDPGEMDSTGDAL